MRKKMLTTMMTGILCTTMVFPAFATAGGANPAGRGTDVFAGIMLDDPDAKVKVAVPTLFAFVVNGTLVAADAADSITVADGSLLLPNVKVEVTTPSDPGNPGVGVYAIQTVGDSAMKFTNYSTKAGAAAADPRVGLEVEMKGSIKNEGTLVSRNNWEHVAAATIGAADQFKKYTLNVGGQSFSQAANGGFTMAAPIQIAAPNLGASGTAGNITYTNMDPVTKLAISGVEQQVDFSVAVGGQRGQYNQVEQSAKVGNIEWTISVAATGSDAPTSPDLPPLAQPNP